MEDDCCIKQQQRFFFHILLETQGLFCENPNKAKEQTLRKANNMLLKVLFEFKS